MELQHGSPDPSDPAVTRRVLTILLAEDILSSTGHTPQALRGAWKQAGSAPSPFQPPAEA